MNTHASIRPSDPITAKHELPALPYGYADLEPIIDARTMTLHHDKHHASYVEQLNKALDEAPELKTRSLIWLLHNANEISKGLRNPIRHNAGGHLNHSLFWRSMAPVGGPGPSGALADAIERDFGGIEQLKASFDEAGQQRFGSGWVWLVGSAQRGRPLQIISTAGHENPLLQGHQPILVNDVWEHAYYLKYQNRRPEYLSNWWSIANWDEACKRYAGESDQIEQVTDRAQTSVR